MKSGNPRINGAALRRRKSRTRKSAPPAERAFVPVLIAYSDIPSAREAMARFTRQLRKARPPAELQPMLWRLDQLSDPRWRETALHDATRATALVLALRNEASFDAAAEAWLVALLERTRGSSLRILALVGENDAWTITLEQPTAGAQPEAARIAAPAPLDNFAATRRKRVPAFAA